MKRDALAPTKISIVVPVPQAVYQQLGICNGCSSRDLTYNYDTTIRGFMFAVKLALSGNVLTYISRCPVADSGLALRASIRKRTSDPSVAVCFGGC